MFLKPVLKFKLSIVLFAFMLCSVIALAQENNSTPAAPQSLLFSILKQRDIAKAEKAASFEFASSRTRLEKHCEHYQRVRTTGLVFLSIGAAFTATGAALIAIGVNYNNTQTYNPYTGATIGTDGDPYLIGGALMLPLGIIGLSAGLPLTIIGSVKVKKFCRGSDKYLERNERGHISFGTNGHNLTMIF